MSACRFRRIHQCVTSWRDRVCCHGLFQTILTRAAIQTVRNQTHALIRYTNPQTVLMKYRHLPFIKFDLNIQSVFGCVYNHIFRFRVLAIFGLFGSNVSARWKTHASLRHADWKNRLKTKRDSSQMLLLKSGVLSVCYSVSQYLCVEFSTKRRTGRECQWRELAGEKLLWIVTFVASEHEPNISNTGLGFLQVLSHFYWTPVLISTFHEAFDW